MFVLSESVVCAKFMHTDEINPTVETVFSECYGGHEKGLLKSERYKVLKTIKMLRKKRRHASWYCTVWFMLTFVDKNRKLRQFSRVAKLLLRA